MDERAFWSLIDETRAEAGGDLTRHAELMVDRLASLSPDGIVEFERLWRERTAAGYRWDLWAAAYVVNGGCSDDCFDYFRDYLVSLGEQTYLAALADPDSLVDVVQPEDDAEWESVSYVAWTAYERAGAGELPPAGPPLPDAPAGEAWDEDDLARIVPRLAARFDW